MKKINILATIILALMSINSYSQDKYPDVVIGESKVKKYDKQQFKVAKKGDKYGFADNHSEFVIKPKFDNAADAIKYKDTYLYPVYYSGKWGLLNQDGSYKKFPILDKCPYLIDNNSIMCHKDGKIFVITLKGEIEYNELSCGKSKLYIPVRQDAPLYFKNSEGSIEKSPTWQKKLYPDKQVYEIYSTIGSFFFDTDNTALFVESGPIVKHKLDFTINPRIHAIWTDDHNNVSVWDDEYNLIFSDCQAVASGNDYVVGVQATKGNLVLYDGMTHTFPIRFNDKEFSHDDFDKFIESLNNKMIRPNKHRLCSGDISKVSIHAEDIYYFIITDKRGITYFYNIDGELLYKSGTNPSFEVLNASKGHIKIIDDGKYGFINTRTKFILPLVKNEQMLPEESKAKRYTSEDIQLNGDDFIANTEQRFTIGEYEEHLYSNFLKDKDINYNIYLNNGVLYPLEMIHYDEVRRVKDINTPEGQYYANQNWTEENIKGVTYDIVAKNGFIFCINQRNREDVKIIINDFNNNLYISIDDFTGVTGGDNTNLNNLSLSWKKPIEDVVYILYEYKPLFDQSFHNTKYEGRKCLNYTINPFTGNLEVTSNLTDLYKSQIDPVYNFVQLDNNGIKKRLILYATDIKFKEKYIVHQNSNREILCLDYDFNQIYNFKSGPQVKVYDCISFENKWILVGSTTEYGNEGHEDFYIIVTDNKGNMISSSHIPEKKGRLTGIRYWDSNIFVVEGELDADPYKTHEIDISIDVHGNITW
jgi:hypothetical protein